MTTGPTSPPAPPARPSPLAADGHGSPHWLSDRAALRLAVVSLALFAAFGGIRLIVAGSQDTVLVPVDELAPTCAVPVDGSDPAASPSCTLQPMTSEEERPSTWGVAKQALGFLQVIVGVILLVYQGLRWHPKRTGQWLGPADPQAPAGADTRSDAP